MHDTEQSKDNIGIFNIYLTSMYLCTYPPWYLRIYLSLPISISHSQFYQIYGLDLRNELSHCLINMFTNLFDIRVLPDNSTGNLAIIWMIQCQWSSPAKYG